MDDLFDRKPHVLSIINLNMMIYFNFTFFFKSHDGAATRPCIRIMLQTTVISGRTDLLSNGVRMTEKMKEDKSVKRGKRIKRDSRKQGRGGDEERRAKYQGACECGGLMVGVPRLQAISLCYQVK